VVFLDWHCRKNAKDHFFEITNMDQKTKPLGKEETTILAPYGFEVLLEAGKYEAVCKQFKPTNWVAYPSGMKTAGRRMRHCTLGGLYGSQLAEHGVKTRRIPVFGEYVCDKSWTQEWKNTGDAGSMVYARNGRRVFTVLVSVLKRARRGRGAVVDVKIETL